MDRRLGEPQMWSGHRGYSGLNNERLVISSVDTILTGLLWLPLKKVQNINKLHHVIFYIPSLFLDFGVFSH
jgi:hypothetical protein